MSAEELPSSVGGAEPAVAGAATEGGGAAPPSSPVLIDSTDPDPTVSASDITPSTHTDIETAAAEGCVARRGSRLPADHYHAREGDAPGERTVEEILAGL